MGIPGFYRWLIQRYPLIIRPFSDISRPVINNLYIDFNQLLFTALSICVNKSDNEIITKEALRYLDSIIQFVRPTTLIFIAIDGSPPYNKYYQDILEKHRNFWNNPPKLHDGSYPENPLFFPGTPFIHKFQKDLREFIKKKTKNDAAWMNPQVVYSSVYNPGESEHKIFEFIQKRTNELKKRRDNNKSKNESSEIHCVFSEDADIIPLIMLTNENNFLLMRPEFKPNDSEKFHLTESSFDLVYVNILREYLIKDHIDPEIKDSSLDLNISNILNNIYSDWVFLTTLVQNDYFKGFLYFARSSHNCHLDHFQKLMDLYEETIMNKNLSLIDKENKEIVLSNLAILLKAFLDHIGEPIDKKNYNDQVASECENLLDNLHWILRYYIGKCPSWSYHYSCNLKFRSTKANIDRTHLLSFSDLYIYIQNLNDVKSYEPPSFDDEYSELTPFEYILAHFPSMQRYLPNPILSRVQQFMDDYEEKNGNTDLCLFNIKDVKRIVHESIPDIRENDLKRNYSTNEFLIIESGNDQNLSFENIALKHPLENVWIPSLNKINNFFQKMKNSKKLIPTMYFDSEEHSLQDLKDYIVNKVILVDYPFLKPFIVKNVKNEEKSKLSGIKGVSIDDDQVLTVIGYPIVISSTDRSSTVICSQLETYPYCLTAPLVSKLEIVLEIMKSTPSTIQKGHKVLITNKDHYGKIGIIKKIEENNKKATVQLLQRNQPKLDKFFKNSHIVNDTFSQSYAIKSIRALEDILDEQTYNDKTTKILVEFDFDDLIWEGKGIKKEQHVKLGDRVVSITHGGPIEFGQFGTVITYNFRYEEVSVVFDNVCDYGSSLYRNLNSTRGIVGKTYDFYII